MSSINSILDHLVVVAADLEQGVAHCNALLGTHMLKGGEHVRTGTHNYLLNLGQGIYLEVIAINPNAAPIAHPRWFGMDDNEQRQRLASGPYLATFAARTEDIASAAIPVLGPIVEMRRGDLKWDITIPDDGGLVENGAMPSLIQWPASKHPTHAMPDAGCRLTRLEVHHPQPQYLAEQWKRIGLEPEQRLMICPSEAGAGPRLVAHIDTPDGVRVLC
ncbi:VOC family protein [Noviherbaspirillum cavernae]|uniref:VOC family protein n=1 Tax=Noviherbaspirillum cavernae TaxID=2320862 RepID=UPI001314FC0B|nr:VOC family protein [Noviherbaspirillum cavernae]